MKLSICMIVKNEEENLQECLESLPSDCEVIVVDTGSTDRTTATVSEYPNVKLYHHVWEDDFSLARNYSLTKATGTHIVVLDADERFRPQTYYELEKYIKDYPDQAASILIHNHDGSEQCSIHRMVRVFPNCKSLRFHGSVHEALHDKGRPISFQMSNISIDHYGYNQSDYVKKKYSFYHQLYKARITKEPENGYMWYQLGKLYASVEQYELACDSFIHAVNFMEEPTLSHASMLIVFSKTLQAVHLQEDAIDLLNSKKQLYSDYPDLYFQLGMLYMDVGAIERIPESFEMALRIGETNKYVTTRGVGSFLSAYNLGVYYEVTSNYERAEYYYTIASKGYPPALNRLKKLNER